MSNRVKYGAKDRRSTGKTVFAFTVSTWDLEKELRAFNNKVGKELLSHLKTEDPGKHVQRLIEHRLSQKAPTSSRRIQTIIAGIYKNKKYSQYKRGSTKMSGPSKAVMMQLVNKKTMDKETNLGRLDKDYPQKHIADFAGNPDKRISGTARNYRKQQGFSLWRMYEYPTKSAYPIPRNPGKMMRFTYSRDNYSSWQYRKMVRWTAGPRGVASSAYYILNASRKMYKDDKGIFARSVARGIKDILKSKTRFH